MVQKAKVFIYAKKCVGEPKLTDFKLIEEELDDPIESNGEFIAEALYFGINAGLRAYQEIFPIGSVIVGAQVAR
jgi:NADPH-dependent curcumin reductase CurA